MCGAIGRVPAIVRKKPDLQPGAVVRAVPVGDNARVPTPAVDLRFTDLRVVRYAESWGYAAGEWARAIASAGDVRPLKQRTTDDGEAWVSVCRAELPLGATRARTEPRAVVIKIERLSSVRKRVQALFRKTKAHRQWRGALIAQHAGVRAAQALAVLHGRDAAGRHVELLVLEAIPGKTLLEHMDEVARSVSPLSVREQHRLAEAVGRFYVNAIIAAANGDPKPSNVIVLNDAAEHDDVLSRFAFVDTTDVQATKGSPDWSLAMVQIESLGCRCPVRIGLRMRALRAFAAERKASAHDTRPLRTHMRGLIQTLTEIVGREHDHTPKDDPLALRSA